MSNLWLQNCQMHNDRKDVRSAFGLGKISRSLHQVKLFSDEKKITIDGKYNRQNDRILAPTRKQADANGGTHRKTKFPPAA